MENSIRLTLIRPQGAGYLPKIKMNNEDVLQYHPEIESSPPPGKILDKTGQPCTTRHALCPNRSSKEGCPVLSGINCPAIHLGADAGAYSARLLAELANSEWVLTENALIRSATLRAELLRRKRQEFTFEERQIIRRGDRALRQLLETHQGLILRLVAMYRTLGYNSNNSDLKQEAALAFFDAVITFDSNKGGKLSTWAYFQIRARLQKITRQTIHDAIAMTRVMQTDPVFSESEPILEQVFFERIHSILDELTSKQRQVVSLYLEGLGWAEIALKLQSTADAVRMLWTRAVQRLRLLLLGECPRSIHLLHRSNRSNSAMSSFLLQLSKESYVHHI